MVAENLEFDRLVGVDLANLMVEREKRPHPLIVGVGPQSVGKSTLLDKVLAKRFSGEYIPEDYQGLEGKLGRLNDFKKRVLSGQADVLDKEEARSLALEIELEFLDRKLAQAQLVKSGLEDHPVFWDASIWTDLIYARTYLLLGIITQEDYDIYWRRFREVLPQLPDPDLMIGLKVSPPVLVNRWQDRLRQNTERRFEETIPEIFFLKMAEVSNQLIDELGEAGFPVLVVNTDEINFQPGKAGEEVVVNLCHARFRATLDSGNQ